MIAGATVCPHCRLRQDGRKERTTGDVLVTLVKAGVGIWLALFLISAAAIFFFLSSRPMPTSHDLNAEKDAAFAARKAAERDFNATKTAGPSKKP